MLHLACGICTGTIKSSTKQLTQVWLGKTFSKPASLKKASLVALPLAISQEVSLETKTLRFFNPDAKKKRKMNLNTVPKMGRSPKNGTAWRSHFWDRMRGLLKKQKKISFTIPFLGASCGTKNETTKSQNQQQRPTRATDRKLHLRSWKTFLCCYETQGHSLQKQTKLIYRQGNMKITTEHKYNNPIFDISNMQLYIQIIL